MSIMDSIQGLRFPAPPTEDLSAKETSIIYHRAVTKQEPYSFNKIASLDFGDLGSSEKEKAIWAHVWWMNEGFCPFLSDSRMEMSFYRCTEHISVRHLCSVSCSAGVLKDGILSFLFLFLVLVLMNLLSSQWRNKPQLTAGHQSVTGFG